MGGPGSGTLPDSPNQRGGRSKKAAVNVCGTGIPVMPDLPKGVVPYWDRVSELTSGVAFEQDSEAVAELAWLLWRQDQFRIALLERPLDNDLNKQSLSIGRSVERLLMQFGLTPRSRQVLLVPKEDQPELDPLEQLQSGYD